MNRIRASIRPVAVVLLFAFLAVASVPGESMAYVVASQQVDSSRTHDMAKVRSALENKVVAQKLEAIGISPKEIAGKLDRLSDRELSQFAKRADKLDSGGDIALFLIAVCLVALLVLAVLSATDRRIVIE